jgi:hypothetical protein
MKTTRISQTVVLMMTLFAGLAIADAQTVLPDAQNQACWQDLNALRQCVATQQQQLADQAARCTSYPEYQCAEPESARELPTKKAQQKARAKKQDSKVEKTATTAASNVRRDQ